MFYNYICVRCSLLNTSKISICFDIINIVCNIHFFLDCGDGTCATGEDCETCPKDCGSCPLKSWAIALIVTFLVLAVTAACIVFGVSLVLKGLFDNYLPKHTLNF